MRNKIVLNFETLIEGDIVTDEHYVYYPSTGEITPVIESRLEGPHPGYLEYDGEPIEIVRLITKHNACKHCGGYTKQGENFCSFECQTSNEFTFNLGKFLFEYDLDFEIIAKALNTSHEIIKSWVEGESVPNPLIRESILERLEKFCSVNKIYKIKALISDGEGDRDLARLNVFTEGENAIFAELDKEMDNAFAPSYIEQQGNLVEEHLCDYCNSNDDVVYGPDPYSEEIHGDTTEHWICGYCREQSAWDI